MPSNDTASALRATLLSSKLSPNAQDSILEPVNVVDGLFAIARALDRVGSVLYGLGDTLVQVNDSVKISTPKRPTRVEHFVCRILGGKK